MGTDRQGGIEIEGKMMNREMFTLKRKTKSTDETEKIITQYAQEQCSDAIHRTKGIASPDIHQGRNDNGKLRAVLDPTTQVLSILLIILSTSCIKFYKEKIVVEPVNIIIIDESRVDNQKIRHIFREIFLEEIIANSKNLVNIFDIDTLDRGNLDYLIKFNIMDYGNLDIEKTTVKLLVSTKVVRTVDKNVISSYVKSAVAKDVESACEKVAEELSRALVKKLIALHRYRIPDTNATPDSL